MEPGECMTPDREESGGGSTRMEFRADVTPV